MRSGTPARQSLTWRLVREPLVHFFAIGALLFWAHHLFVGEPRTIAITPGVRAELARRFQDQNGRKPEPQELAKAQREWERDEALYREALREHLDRDDPGVRAIMVGKMRERLAFELEQRTPTDAELRAWFDAHRATYETPIRYDFEFIAFPKNETSAEQELEKVERTIADGKNPATLGRPVVGGDLTLTEMKDRVVPELIERIPKLAPGGPWQRVESEQSFFLAHVKQVTGGLPSFESVKPQLLVDWSASAQRDALERRVDSAIASYRFAERP